MDEGCLAVLREVVPPFEHFETISNALHTLIWLVCRENQVAMVEYGLVQDLLALSAEIQKQAKVTLVEGPS